MRRKLLPVMIIATALAGAACKPATSAPDAAPAADPTREPILASDLLLRQTTAELNFRWAAPPEAAVEPKLFRLLRADAEKALKSATEAAAQTASDAKQAGFPFHENEYRQNWKPEAETPTLIALSAQTYSFTGGAHGNMGYDAAIFDRKAGRRIGFADLFTSVADALTALTPAWCRELDAERADKRGSEKIEGFTDCPPLGEQVIVPVGEGQISQLRILVAPYVAGPWVEGGYEVTLSVDAVRPLLKSSYAKDFTPS